MAIYIDKSDWDESRDESSTDEKILELRRILEEKFEKDIVLVKDADGKVRWKVEKRRWRINFNSIIIENICFDILIDRNEYWFSEICFY